MLKSLNAARAGLRCAMIRQTSISSSRTFLTTPARRDIVQDLYVKAIGAHKPTAAKASDAEGNVQKFKMPATPASPEESNIANEIKEYETQTVEVEGASGTEGVPEEEDWFEKDLEIEEDKPAGHGH